MTSSQSIAVTMVFSIGVVFVPAAWADPASDACAALVDARGSLYSMLNAKDKSAQDAVKAQMQAAGKRTYRISGLRAGHRRRYLSGSAT